MTMTISQFVSYVALVVANIANMLGLWIIGFGLWPRSWWAVIFFGVINHVVIYAIRQKLDDEVKKAQ